MKIVIVSLMATATFPCEVSAANCLNESVYDTSAVAKIAKADTCYFSNLEQIPSPQSMSDRQYNYFASRINEYAQVFGEKAIDKASLEFMFYPETRKGALSVDDARIIDFTYVQNYTCVSSGKATTHRAFIHVSGTVGQTGVCLTANEKVCSSKF